MEYTAIVTVLILLQLFAFAFLVGRQRAKHGIKAPAIAGHPEFERAFRAHQNTVEQLVIFLPGMWIYATFGNPLIAAGAGVVFIVGRQIFRTAYVADPAKRSTGFAIGMLATAFVVIGGLIAAVLDLL